VTVFQPIVHLGDRRIVGFEALTRFDDDRPPELWFSEAAELGLAAPLERATLQVAAATASQLPTGRYVSINVSAAILQGPEDLHLLPDLACRPIVLELTEHDAVDDYEAVRQTIRSLTDVSLAVDDAGAGYSSLSHILALRPDFIKLDKTWVRDVPTDTVRQALVSGLVHFSNASNAALIAEGIETEDEARVLADLGVTFGQGFLFGAAAPAEAWKP
jgi:EAL domain-containing protein (putative c-di-GMP-specific phosphodiesterase class I)